MLYKITEDTIYFYSNQGDYNFMNLVSIFPMIENEIMYETIEQYLLIQKLDMFQPTNVKLRRLILSTHNPVLYTVYNRKIQNVNMDQWNSVYLSLLRHACKLRLDQHPNLKKRLYRTKGKRLMYAHSKDRYLGVGFGVKDAWTTNPMFFGENHLGRIWEELRSELNEEEYVNVPYSKRETKTLKKQQEMIERNHVRMEQMVGVSSIEKEQTHSVEEVQPSISLDINKNVVKSNIEEMNELESTPQTNKKEDLILPILKLVETTNKIDVKKPLKQVNTNPTKPKHKPKKNKEKYEKKKSKKDPRM